MIEVVKLNLGVYPEIKVNVSDIYEYDALMQIYEAGNLKWIWGYRPTSLNNFLRYGKETCLGLTNPFCYGSKTFYVNEGKQILKLGEFLKLENIPEVKINAILEYNDKSNYYRKSLGRIHPDIEKLFVSSLKT